MYVYIFTGCHEVTLKKSSTISWLMNSNYKLAKIKIDKYCHIMNLLRANNLLCLILSLFEYVIFWQYGAFNLACDDRMWRPCRDKLRILYQRLIHLLVMIRANKGQLRRMIALWGIFKANSRPTSLIYLFLKKRLCTSGCRY